MKVQVQPVSQSETVSEINDCGNLDRKCNPRTRIMAGETQFVQVLLGQEHDLCKWVLRVSGVYSSRKPWQMAL